MLSVIILAERPDTADAVQLIAELGRYISPLYPHDSEHGLSPEEMAREGVAFFILRSDGEPAGCGGIWLRGTDYGEIVRMYVRPAFRGKGLGKRLLGHLEAYARDSGIRVLRLKTGIFQPEALGLYERLGYQEVPPFGEYRAHPLNRYYEKQLF